MIEAFVSSILYLVEVFGYGGIFIMTTLESTFVPIPSEITMVPAGYLIYQDKMHPAPVFLLSVAGTVTGSLINYAIADRYGRKLLLRYPKLFMLDEEKLAKMEQFFQKHGPVSIFLGRLVFGVRHYISFPAGLAKMDLKLFTFYTAAGGSLWVTMLLGLGYAFGGNEEFIATLLPAIKGTLALIAVGAIIYYLRRHKKKSIN